jgi:hypothetical protein
MFQGYGLIIMPKHTFYVGTCCRLSCTSLSQPGVVWAGRITIGGWRLHTMMQQLTYKSQLSQKRALEQGLPHPAFRPYQMRERMPFNLTLVEYHLHFRQPMPQLILA